MLPKRTCLSPRGGKPKASRYPCSATLIKEGIFIQGLALLAGLYAGSLYGCGSSGGGSPIAPVNQPPYIVGVDTNGDGKADLVDANGDGLIDGNIGVSDNSLFPLEFRVIGKDPDGAGVTYTIANAPPGSNFDGGTGIFDWDPACSQDGPWTPRFRPVDSEGKEGSAVGQPIEVTNDC